MNGLKAILTISIALLPLTNKANYESKADFFKKNISKIQYGFSQCIVFSKKVYEHLIQHGKGEEAVQIIDKVLPSQEARTAALEVTQKIANSLESIEKNTNETKGVLTVLSENVSKNDNALEKYSAWVKGAAVLSGITGLYCAIKGVHEGYRYFYPSEQEKNNNALVIQQLKFLKARKKLNKCLVRNVDDKKRSDGLPETCKEYIEMFQIVASYDEFHKVKEAFNQQ